MNIIEQNEQKLVIQFCSFFNTTAKPRRKWGIIGLVVSFLISPLSPLFVETYQLNCTRIEPKLIDCSVKNVRFLGLNQREEILPRINDIQNLSKSLNESFLTDKKVPRNVIRKIDSFFGEINSSDLNLFWWNGRIPKQQFLELIVISSLPLFILSFLLLLCEDETYCFNNLNNSLTLIKENSFQKRQTNYNFDSLQEIGYQENWHISEDNYLRPSNGNLTFICSYNIVTLDDVGISTEEIGKFIKTVNKFFGLEYDDYYYAIENYKKAIKIVDNKRNREYLFNKIEGKFYQIEITTQNKIKECFLDDITNIYPHLIITREADEDTIEMKQFGYIVIELKNGEQVTILDEINVGGKFYLNSLVSSLKKFINCWKDA